MVHVADKTVQDSLWNNSDIISGDPDYEWKPEFSQLADNLAIDTLL